MITNDSASSDKDGLHPTLPTLINWVYQHKYADSDIHNVMLPVYGDPVRKPFSGEAK
jgi:hypothetical protein